MSSKASDKKWASFNKTLLKAMKNSDWTELKMTYFDMALFCYEEQRPFFQLLQEACKAELRGYEQSGVVKRVRIITAKSASCEHCAQLHGSEYSVEGALEAMPIPVKGCTTDLGKGNGWCRCTYGPVVK